MAVKGFWMRRVADGIRGVSEALFPRNDLGAPDWEQTEMVNRTLAWLEEVPDPQRRLLELLFVSIDLGAPFLVPGFRRFSRLEVERRTRAIRTWRDSGFYPFRLLGDALKASVTMTYMSHPAVLRHMGQFKVCENPDDPCLVDIRPDALSEEAQ